MKIDFILTEHAKEVLKSSARLNIKMEWIEQALAYPEYTDIDLRNGRIRIWKRISEYGDRDLRVACEPNTQPIEVVTVFFDRGFKK